MTSPLCFAVIPAGGSGRRYGAAKQFLPLAGRAVLWHALQPFLSLARVRRVRVVVASDCVEQGLAAVAGCDVDVLPVGGATRAESVCNGLAGLPDDAWVLVHDAARPCLSVAALRRLLAFVDGGGEGGADGAVLALPVSEALKRVRDGRVADSVARDGLWTMQTPQLFRVAPLRRALRQCPEAADEAEAMLAAGGAVDVVMGERRNIKITYADDLPLAARLLSVAGVEFGAEVDAEAGRA